MRIIVHLLPQLETFCESTGVNDEAAVVDFLKVSNTSFVIGMHFISFVERLGCRK